MRSWNTVLNASSPTGIGSGSGGGAIVVSHSLVRLGHAVLVMGAGWRSTL